MKKILLLAVLAFTLTGCDIESDEPKWVSQLAEVTSIDVPDHFERGKSYTIEVSYLLPTACHIPQGLSATREAAYGSGRRKIFVAGIAAYEFGAPECDKESTDLEKTGSFSLLIDEDMSYTFFLWTGLDSTGENIYTEIEVPVIDPNAEQPQ